jgi:hypothetical protein
MPLHGVSPIRSCLLSAASSHRVLAESACPRNAAHGLDRPASIFYKTNIRFICKPDEEPAMMDIGTIFALPLVDSGAITWTLPWTGSRLTFLLIALVVVLLLPLFNYARWHLIRHAARDLAQPVGGLLKMPFMKSWGRPDVAAEQQSADRRAA